MFSVGWLWRWMGPVMLMVTGFLLLVMSLLHRPSLPNLTAE
jgi:ABC-type multidrug transport system permease subunit